VKLLTQISSIIVSLLLVYTISFKTIITTNFYVNQSSLTELFCINKEKPQLQCNGKCHLTKELIKTDSQKDELPFSQNNTEYNLELTLDLINHKTIVSEPFKTLSKEWNHFSEKVLNKEYPILIPPPKA